MRQHPNSVGFLGCLRGLEGRAIQAYTWSGLVLLGFLIAIGLLDAAA
jgi:hypothetical protein